MNKNYFIGVDGGGTKTITALANEKGKILKIAKTGPSSPRNIKIETAVSNIEKGIKKVLSGGNLIFAFIGLGIYLLSLYLMKEFTKKDLMFFLDLINPKKMMKYMSSELKNKKSR